MFDKIKDVVLLSKIINKAKPGISIINTKENMNNFNQVENLNLAISVDKSFGLNTIGFNYDNIILFLIY